MPSFRAFPRSERRDDGLFSVDFSDAFAVGDKNKRKVAVGRRGQIG